MKIRIYVDETSLYFFNKIDPAHPIAIDAPDSVVEKWNAAPAVFDEMQSEMGAYYRQYKNK